jgi:hypothetical protein
MKKVEAKLDLLLTCESNNWPKIRLNRDLNLSASFPRLTSAYFYTESCVCRVVLMTFKSNNDEVIIDKMRT